MKTRQQIHKICRATASISLTFLTGLGVYSAVNEMTAVPQQNAVRPPLEYVQPESNQVKTVEEKEEPRRNPFLGDGCPTCGMG